MANLGSILAVNKKDNTKPKKPHPAVTKEFTTFELQVLHTVDYARGPRYDLVYGTGTAPGSKEFLEQQKKKGDPTVIGEQMVGPDVARDYVEGLLDDYGRWQKTGSRFVQPETDITRRKKYMGKRYTGNLQGFTGARGTLTTQKKTLLGA